MDMALNNETEKAEQFAAELAKQAGETKTQAVIAS
jgi:hypothetical protein